MFNVPREFFKIKIHLSGKTENLEILYGKVNQCATKIITLLYEELLSQI